MSIKLLIGGSPCTHWSIAQKNNRETEPEGLGWELFKNYLIAKEKFKPDFFLYENNKSAAQAIKDQIAEEFGVGVDPDVRFTYINSALVSAQNRQRFYVTNFGDIEQPEDRGILLKDILETGDTDRDKARCVTASVGRTTHREYLQKQQNTSVFEPLTPFVENKLDAIVEKYGYLPEMFNPYNKAEVTDKAPTQTAQGESQTKSSTVMYCEPVRIPEYGVDNKSRPLSASYSKGSGEGSLKSDAFPDDPKQVFDYVSEPVRVGCMPSPDGEIKNSQGMRVYSTEGKSVNLTAQGGGLGAKTGLYAIPVNTTPNGKSQTIKAQYQQTSPANILGYTSTYGATGVAEPVNTTENGDKARTLMAGYYKYGTATLITNEGFKGGTTAVSEPVGYATPVEWDENGKPTKAISCADGKTYTVYEVKDGRITIKGKQYPIKLEDGYYIIRKLTVRECARLQTMPDDYCKAVSDSQAYKALGNGWTAEVIIHLLNHALKDVPRDEEIIVLSLYDGIATGRYCLEKMGFTNVKYHAYEIDKYPIQVAMDNYPEIIQHGDAFAVREDDWQPPQTRSEWLDELLGA